MKIGIANDHSAVDMKKEVVAYLESQGHEVINYGTDSYESTDYPVWGEKVANAVANDVPITIALAKAKAINILNTFLMAHPFSCFQANRCQQSYPLNLPS